MTSKSANWAFYLAEKGRELENGKVLWFFSPAVIGLCSFSPSAVDVVLLHWVEGRCETVKTGLVK